MGSRADGKGKGGFLLNAVDSEALDTSSKRKMLFPCSSVNTQAERRGETKMSFITCSVLVKLLELRVFKWKRRNGRCSLCNFFSPF